MPRNISRPNGLSKESIRVTYDEIGTSGLDRTNGIINEEWLIELGDLYKSNKIYKEMRDNDPIIGAFFLAVDMYIRKVTWYSKPGGISQQALEKADFLESCMQDLQEQTWNDIISEIMSMLWSGWSIAEKVYKVRNKQSGSKFDDNKIGWARFGFRAQETLYEWLYDDNNKLIGMVQTDPITFKNITMPIEKLLHFRTKVTKDNPQGRSLLRNIFKPWWFKKHLEEFEAIGLEHSAIGVPIGWVPENMTDANKTAFSQAIVKMQTGKGGAIILPLKYDQSGNKLYDLTLLEGSSKTSEISQIGIVIDRYDTRIAQALLYEVVVLGTQGKGGSYALSENKSNSFVLALTTFLQMIKEVFNKYAVVELFKLNGDNLKELPSIEFMPILKADLKEVGEYLKSLSASGAPLWPNRELAKWTMTVAGMPEPEDEELDETLLEVKDIPKEPTESTEEEQPEEEPIDEV